MRRREFMRLLGVAAAMRPLVARAQPSTSPVVGFLAEASPESMTARVAAFRQGLDEIGYVDGHNVTIDWRSAERQPNRLRALAADLIGRRAAAIVTAGDLATVAAKSATSAIPIVFLSPSDPAGNGLAGPNVTGLSWFGADLVQQRFTMLHQLVPNAAAIGLLIDQGLAEATSHLQEVHAAADSAGVKLVVLHAGNAADIDAAFATMAAQQLDAIVVGNSTFFTGARAHLLEVAARQKIPAIYAAYEMAADGGLASYGHSASDAFRRAGIYTGWILKGARPADLPILQSSKFELVINLKTAQALGLELPPNMLAGADELIQ